MKGRLPDFIIIGACRSGTTTLYKYLTLHPQIFMSTPKEPEFFSREDNYSRGLEWYTSLFEEAADNQICGEASTTYTRWPVYPTAETPNVPQRIYDVMPRVKLIYIMRNPIERAYSHYRYHQQKGVKETFEEALQRTSVDDDWNHSEYIYCGLYKMQIERFLNVFPPEAILFLLLDDLEKDPNQVLTSIERFLKIDHNQIDLSKREIHSNSSTERLIQRKINKIPFYSNIKSIIPKSIRNKVCEFLKISKVGTSISHTQPPSVKTIRRLSEIYQAPNRELGEFLGHDLSHWSKFKMQ